MGKKYWLVFGSLVIFLFFVWLYWEEEPSENPLVAKEDISIEHPEEEHQEEEKNDQPIKDNIREKVNFVIERALEIFTKEDLKIVAIGDSLTQGVGSTDEIGYVGMIENTLNKTRTINALAIDNYGKRGNRTDQLLKRLDNEEIRDSIENADIMLVTIGANDVMAIVKNNLTNLNYEVFYNQTGSYKSSLIAVFDKIQTINPQVRFYLIGVYNPFREYFSDVQELNQIMVDWNQIGREVMNSYEMGTFIPIKDLFEPNTNELLSDDNFHPNDKGYQLIGERVLEYIAPVISRKEE
ncbi:GDSL-type esterase/lipase family protein [Bacillaceae bacterium S4-13-56]